MLVGTEHLLLLNRVLLVIDFLKYVLTNFCIILMQTVKGSGQTLE